MRVVRWVVAGSCLVLAAPSVRADALDDARREYERGSVAYALGRYATAALAYEEAFSAKPDPALLYNAAQAHRLAGNKRRALLLYRSYLTSPLFTRTPAAQKRVERRIAELEEAIERDDESIRAEPAPSKWSAPESLAPPREKKPPRAEAEPPAALVEPSLAAGALLLLLIAWLMVRVARRRRVVPTSPAVKSPPRKTVPFEAAITVAGVAPRFYS